jgi:hypothetical protein
VLEATLLRLRWPARHRLVGVHQEEDQQRDLRRHHQRVRHQRVRVVVEELRAAEHHQVAREMEDEVREEQEAGESDEQLGAD